MVSPQPKDLDDRMHNRWIHLHEEDKYVKLVTDVGYGRGDRKYPVCYIRHTDNLESGDIHDLVEATPRICDLINSLFGTRFEATTEDVA